jgi:hypothetical protein
VVGGPSGVFVCDVGKRVEEEKCTKGQWPLHSSSTTALF